MYDATEIDAVAAYCQELKRCYWLPIDLVEGKRVDLAPADDPLPTISRSR